MFPPVLLARRAAVLLLLAEALVLLGFAVAWTISLVRGAVYPQAVVGLVVMALLGAGVLALCARGTREEKAWTRAPVVTFQLLLGIMGVEWVRGHAPWVGVAAVLVAVLVTALMLRPGVVQNRRPLPED